MSLESLRPGRAKVVLGVDLSADAGETCAAAILRWHEDSGWRVAGPTQPLDDDQRILAAMKEVELVALDGPRRPPTGFRRFVKRGEAPPEGAARSRACEREHTRRICPIFYSSPVATAGVQRWMMRSWKLFEASEQSAIEIYPMGGFVAALNGVEKRKPHGLANKKTRAGREARLHILEQLIGAQVWAFAERVQGNEKAHDRVDALMAAVTAAAHGAGRSVELGIAEEGTIVVQNLSRALPR